MENSTKVNLYFYSSLVCALWFVLTSWCWFYLANVIFSFPVGVVSLYLWYQGQKTEVGSLRFSILKYVLVLGVASAVVSLISLFARY